MARLSLLDDQEGNSRLLCSDEECGAELALGILQNTDFRQPLSDDEVEAEDRALDALITRSAVRQSDSDDQDQIVMMASACAPSITVRPADPSDVDKIPALKACD